MPNAADLRAAARRHAHEVVAPHVAAWEAEARFPREAAHAAAGDGLLGLFAPKAVGGQGLTFAQGMGVFEEGTQGAFRFEVQGIVDGRPLLVVEHVTRIDDDCAPDWPTSTQPGGIHRVRISGHPNLDVTIHGTEPGEPGAAGGGNATAANRIVNAIPAVCAAAAGPVSPLDLPPITGARQVRRR